MALNKIDDPEVKARLPEIKAAFAKKGIEFMQVSGLARTDIHALLRKAVHELANAPKPGPVQAPLPVYKPAEDPRDYRIAREEEHRWRLSGAAIERAANMTYWEHEGSVRALVFSPFSLSSSL